MELMTFKFHVKFREHHLISWHLFLDFITPSPTPPAHHVMFDWLQSVFNSKPVSSGQLETQVSVDEDEESPSGSLLALAVAWRRAWGHITGKILLVLPVLAAHIGGSFGGYTLGEGSSIWDSHTAASVVGAGEVKGPHWGAVLGMGSSSPGNVEHWYALWMGC